MTLKTAARDIRFMNELFSATERIASDLGDDEPGPEHLVLAALNSDDGLALSLLAEHGVSPESFREAIRAVHRDSLVAVGVEPAEPEPTGSFRRGAFRASPAFNAVFTRARARAKKRELRSSDLVIAAAEREHGTIVRVFDALGVDRAAIAAS